MNVSRRRFLRNALGLAGGIYFFISGPCTLRQESSPISMPSEHFVDDFTVVELEAPEKVESLEEVLDKGSEEIPNVGDIFPELNTDGDSEVRLQIPRIPDLMYNYTFKESGRVYSGGLSGAWSGITLNSHGFFLISYHNHNIDGLINDNGRKQDYHLTLMHNTITGRISEPRILAFSRKYEIALGISPTDENYSQAAIPVTRAPITPGGTIIAASHDFSDAAAFLKDINSELISSGEFQYSDGNGNIFSYAQNKPCRRAEGLETNLQKHFAAIPKNYSENPNYSEGFYPVKMHSEEGDSGCPVYTIDGSLAGITVRRDESRGITYCVEPRIIRGLIRQYIDAVNAKANSR